jgi:hypothetical protein
VLPEHVEKLIRVDAVNLLRDWSYGHSHIKHSKAGYWIRFEVFIQIEK